MCRGTHNHQSDQTGGNYPSGITRVAHCPPKPGFPGQYELNFPFNTKTERLAFWIDKGNRRFYAVGAGPEPDQDLELAEALRSQLNVSQLNVDCGVDEDRSILLKSGTEELSLGSLGGGDEETTSWTVNSIVLATSNSVLGKEQDVRSFLTSSAEAEILVLGKDGEGNSLLTMIAAEVYPRMVTLFLDQGAMINSRNNSGRSPLMEAALWGRFENAKILLDRGADKEVRDMKGRKAIDFVLKNDVDAEERHLRTGGTYKEDTFDADKQRESISWLLGGQPVKSSFSHDLSTYEKRSCDYHSFHRSESNSEIVLTGPVATFPVPRMTKTIARLDRVPPFPPVDAMSGWNHHDEQNVTISGKHWTEEVFVLCESVGHILRPDLRKDQGRQGWWHACHAEKQLVAFFVAYHIFLQYEVREEEEEEERNLRQLYLAHPPVSLKHARIMISRAACTDCEAFMQRVKSALGICFDLRSS